MMYRIQTLRGRQAAILKLNGLLDVDAVLELNHAVDAILEQSIFEIVVDLENVATVNSAGWGVFVSKLARVEKGGGHIRFVAMRPVVQQIFELLGLSRSKTVVVHANVEDAIEASMANASI